MSQNSLGKKLPRPKESPIVGSTLVFHRQPLDFVLRQARELGDVSAFHVGLDRWVLVNDPKLIHEVLVSQAQRYQKPRLVKRLWRLFLGNGLLSAEGDDWKRLHLMVRPAFHRGRIEAYGRTMVDYTQQMIDRWEAGTDRDMTVDISALTLRIVGKTLFDADCEQDAPTVGTAMEDLQETLVQHIQMPLPVPTWWPSAQNRKKLKAIKDIEDIVMGMVRERQKTGEDRGDLLSMLVHARDEEGGGLNDKELRDQAMTLIFAGHETTAIALVWMWYTLACHPEVVARLQADIDAVTDGGPLQVAHLRELPYLDMVVKEAMRIRPSVWSFMREPIDDVNLGGFHIPGGSIVFISPYVTQHDDRWFPEPEEFRPERFSPEAEAALPKGAYVPFAAGPRQCLGKQFAMMEARLILGTLVQRMNVQVKPDFVPVYAPMLSLRPRDGVPFTVSRRTV